MQTREDGGLQRTNRRRFIKMIVGSFAAVLGLQSQLALGVDNCYWETRVIECSNGRKWAYRCEICCAGGVCETVQCLWFDIGPC